MAYNLSRTKFAEFVKFKGQIEAQNRRRQLLVRRKSLSGARKSPILSEKKVLSLRGQCMLFGGGGGGFVVLPHSYTSLPRFFDVV